MSHRTVSIVTVTSTLCLATGCASTSPGTGHSPRTYVLAAQVTREPVTADYRPATHRENALQSSAPTAPATQPTTTAPGVARSSSQPATSPARKPYTAPGAAARQLTIIPMALSAGAMGQLSSNGREASEAAVGALGAGGLGSITGSPGLSAPQAITLNAIPSQPGLGAGFPIGFGPAPAANLFTRQLRPLSGPTGSCNDLVRAGFFGDNQSCLRYFRR